MLEFYFYTQIVLMAVYLLVF